MGLSNSAWSLSLIIFAVFNLSSCVRHPAKSALEFAPKLPQHFQAATETPAQASAQPSMSTASEPWWEAFADPSLNDTIARALDANPGLEAAAARLRQANALATQAGAALWPTLDASASARRARIQSAGREITSGTYGLGLSLNYELDLWRKLDARAKAGALDASASREDYRAAALALSASVARAYLGIQYQQELIATLESERELNQKFREVIERRFGQGRATAVEVYQQREAVAALEAQLPLANANLASANNLLATLLGNAPNQASKITTSQGMLAPNPLPSLGIPAELLQNRPDLRAALVRVQAVDQRLGAAIADRLPSFRISADVAYQASSFSDLFDKWVWSLAGNLVGPLFDRGRREAEAQRVKAQLDEQLARYREATLGALREVEDALVQEKGLELATSKLELQLQLAESAVDAQQSRYLQGIGDYLTLLLEMQNRERLRRSILANKRARIEAQIDLSRALASAPPPENRAAHSQAD